MQESLGDAPRRSDDGEKGAKGCTSLPSGEPEPSRQLRVQPRGWLHLTRRRRPIKPLLALIANALARMDQPRSTASAHARSLGADGN